MVMRSLRDGAADGFMKYILFGLLGMSVGGLVVMDVRGVLTGGGSGVGANDVVRVGKESVSIQDFDRDLTLAISKYGVSPQQAHKIGLTKDVLRSEIRKKLLYTEAQKVGVDIPKEQLAKNVADIVRPNVRKGESLQETLNAVLKQQRMSEATFVQAVNEEVSGRIYADALQEAYHTDEELLAYEMYRFQRQTRDLELIYFKNDDIKETIEATDEQLLKLYDALKAGKYRIPEYRSAKMAVINPKEITVDVKITDYDLEEAYKKHIDKFMQGEKFVITQAITDTPEQAQAVFDAVQGGLSLEDAAKKVMGDNVRYYNGVPFERAMILPTMMAAMEDRQLGVVKPPVESPLGHHVLKLDSIVPAGHQSFEEVKELIRSDLTKMHQGDKLYALAKEFEEQLVSGTKFNDIKTELPFVVKEIPFVDDQGNTPEGKMGLQEYDGADHEEMLQALFELEQGEPSLLKDLPSGMFVAFSLEDVKQASFMPFEDVKEEIKAQFIEDQKAADNVERLRKYIAELSEGARDMAMTARDSGKPLKTINDVAIFGPMEAPLNDGHRPVIFQGKLDGYNIIEFDDGFGLIHILDYGYLPESISSPEGQSKEDIAQGLQREQNDEVLLTFLRKLQSENIITVNERLLDSVYGGDTGGQ